MSWWAKLGLYLYPVGNCPHWGIVLEPPITLSQNAPQMKILHRDSSSTAIVIQIPLQDGTIAWADGTELAPTDYQNWPGHTTPVNTPENQCGAIYTGKFIKCPTMLSTFGLDILCRKSLLIMLYYSCSVY